MSIKIFKYKKIDNNNTDDSNKILLGKSGQFDQDIYGDNVNTIGNKEILSTGYVKSISTDDNDDDELDNLGGKYIYNYY